MVYIFGLFGAMIGFGVGLGTINVLLRHHGKSEIQDNKSQYKVYSLLVWAFAILGGMIGVWFFNHNFL